MTKDEMLDRMAEDAFNVQNWARRIGLKKPQQIKHIRDALELSLCEAKWPDIDRTPR